MKLHCRLQSVHRPTSLIFAALVAFAAAPAVASENEGIVVRGNGSATGRPTEIEMSATLSAEAPLAADALVKFRDAKKRALAAIAGLKNSDLSIEPGGVSVGSGNTDANTQMMIMRGMAVANSPQSVHLSETSRILLVHADKLAPDELLEKVLKIVDVAKDAGFQFGPAPATNYWELQMRAQEGGNSPTVSFKLHDSAPLRERAYKAALDDARTKAEKLAELSGAKLGRTLSVHDGATAKSDSTSAIMNIYGFMGNQNKNDEASGEKALSGSTSGDLTLHVSLEVQFEIVPEPIREIPPSAKPAP